MGNFKNFVRLCPFFDALNPLGILRKILQEDKLCLMRAIKPF